MIKPRVPITDPAFRYVPSHKTDVRETFERIKREQPKNVIPLKEKR